MASHRDHDGDELAVCVVGAALIDLISYVPRIGETLHGSDFRNTEARERIRR